MMMRPKVDLFTLTGILMLVFFGYQLVPGRTGESIVSAAGETDAAATVIELAPEPSPAEAAPLAAPAPAPDDNSFVPPYETYWLTQGLHGQSYGHLAIDIAAGLGATIFSPIQGAVTQRYSDQWGNTIIVIENSRYAVTLYHGDYWPGVGEPVALGQAIGTENNHGYTMDSQGNLCAGRDCGYHTHLNVFDKAVGANIDPLTLMPTGR